MRIRITLLLLTCLAGVQAYAQDAMTGMFRMSHTVGEVLGDQYAQALSDRIPADEVLNWQVFVPHGYDPARPPGVFIYLDPNRYGGIPDPWVSVFNDRNLIWVGPRAGNRRQSTEAALWHAIIGLRAIEGQYDIDLSRIYIGSARDTTTTAFYTYLTANEISGAVYMRGSAMWRTIEDEQLELLRRKRHVFITGTNDEAKTQVRQHFESYKDAGIEGVKLIFDTKRIEAVPKPEQIEEAIRFLDSG